jgi:beta-lactamase superfamily II metal-dependent hydrolase
MKRRIDDIEVNKESVGERPAKRMRTTPLVTAVLSERAPGSQFHTQFLPSFTDTGKLPHFLTPEKQREIAANLEKVVGEKELARREKDYKKFDLGQDRTGKRELVDKTWTDLLKHYDARAESDQLYLKELFKQEQVKALKVKGGSLSILFTPVGHGDCTVIRTPAGKTLVIDCGSSGGFGVDRDEEPEYEVEESECEDLRVRHSIQALLGKRRRLDFLILTHPDVDHHNKLETVFAEAKIGKVYHSAAFSEYTKTSWVLERIFPSEEDEEPEELDQSTAKAFINQVYFHYSSKIGRVAEPSFITRLVDLGGTKHTPQKYDARKPNKVDCFDEDGGLLIWAERDCRISILSSNVNQEHVVDNSRGGNRGSVVVLIKAFGKKILICGDATFNTENELIKRYGEKISNIDVLRVGHHGSGWTSSQPAFTNHVRAKIAWISERNKNQFHSPSIEVIKRLCDHSDSALEPHDLCFYSGLNNYQLSKLRPNEKIRIGDTDVEFTRELIDSYARKQVHVTATSLNPVIVFPSH